MGKPSAPLLAGPLAERDGVIRIELERLPHHHTSAAEELPQKRPYVHVSLTAAHFPAAHEHRGADVPSALHIAITKTCFTSLMYYNQCEHQCRSAAFATPAGVISVLTHQKTVAWDRREVNVR